MSAPLQTCLSDSLHKLLVYHRRGRIWPMKIYYTIYNFQISRKCLVYSHIDLCMNAFKCYDSSRKHNYYSLFATVNPPPPSAKRVLIRLHTAIAFQAISHTQVVTNNFYSMHSHNVIVHLWNYCVYDNYVNHHVYVYIHGEILKL
jgi:hypothetical protein